MVCHEHVERVKQGLDVWNKWRRKHRSEKPRLCGVNLRAAKFAGADFSFVDFTGGYLRWTDCSNANFSRAHLGRANLKGANLNDANFTEANLSRAEFCWANLNGANLSGANLKGADFTGANLQETKISIEQLSTAKTLYKVKMDAELIKRVRSVYPHLLEKPDL